MGAVHVCAHHPQVGPEQRLGEQRGRGAGEPEAKRGLYLAPGGGLVAEARAGRAPQPSRGDQGQSPRGVVAPHRRIDAAAVRERDSPHRDPGQRLADPEHPQRGSHRLQSAGRTEVDVGGGGVGDRERGDRDLAVAGHHRAHSDRDRGQHADAGGDRGASVDQASERGRRARPARDRDVAHGREIHAEAAAGGGDERHLHRHGHQSQALAAEVATDQDLHAERRQHARAQADDVQGGAREQGALVAHIGGVFRIARRFPAATPDSRGRAAAPRRRAPPRR
jgi:hypothetical protein